MEIPPKYSIAEVVQKLKSNTSAELKKKFKFINQMCLKRHSVWSAGYFVSTVGLNENQIRKYIERQNNYDCGYDVADELS